MATYLQPSTCRDLDQIVDLLCRAFNVDRDAYFVGRDLLSWKYQDSAAGLPCSYVLRQGDAAVAHCGTIPLTLMVPGGADGGAPQRVATLAFIDWAAGRQLPGAGVILKKKLMAQADVSLVIGGTPGTRAALPRIGFSVRQNVELFARVVRPFRQAMSRPRRRLLKDTARVLRNAAWSMTPGGRLSRAWRAVPVREFSSVPAPSAHAAVMPERCVPYLNYWLRCPVGRPTGYEIHRADEMVGYFLLTAVGGQARIADLRVGGSSRTDWEMAYRLAARTAAADPSICEVTCAVSTPATREAVVACGFRRRDTLPLYVADPKGRLTSAPPLFWNLIDSDLAYVYDAANPFLT